MSVQHRPEEKTSIVNFKKGIAAAFQANFKKTVEEVEEDTQSKHISHYRLVKILSRKLLINAWLHIILLLLFILIPLFYSYYRYEIKGEDHLIMYRTVILITSYILLRTS